MWLSVRSICCFAVIALFPAQIQAETQLFRGDMDVVTGSGSQCEGFLGRRTISLVLESDGDKSEVRGYLEGDDISIGKLSGADLTRMAVVYPYDEAERATGHHLSLSSSNGQLSGELLEKHMDASVEVCSFDLARLNLKLVAEGEPAKYQMQQGAKLFDAQLTASTAHALVTKGDYANAVPLFQKLLDLADTGLNHDKFLLDNSIFGLASCYVKLGRFNEFNRIYDERFGAVTNQWFKSTLNAQRGVVQFHLGSAAVKRGNYDEALKILIPAYDLNMQNMDIISSIITSYFQSNRFDEAIRFLEQAGSKLIRESDRKVVVGTIAMVSYYKAKKDEKAGNESQAETDMRKAVGLNPDFAPFWIALARLRHKAGSFDEANALLQEGLLRFKDEPSRGQIVAALEKMQQIEMIMKSVR